MLHGLHVLERDDVLVTGGRDHDVGPADGLLDCLDLEAVHERLQGVDGVDLGDRDASALAAKCLGTTLADVSVTADQRSLAADQNVGAAVDAVEQRVARAVLVVELALGDRVVDVDSGEREFTGSGNLVQAQNARGGLLGDALDGLGDCRPLSLVGLEGLTQKCKEDLVLVGILVVVRRRDDAGLLELCALEHQHGGVAAIVENHVGRLTRPGQHLLGCPPVLFEGFTLPGENRNALGLFRGAVRTDDDGGGSVILRGEDVA